MLSERKARHMFLFSSDFASETVPPLRTTLMQESTTTDLSEEYRWIGQRDEQGRRGRRRKAICFNATRNHCRFTVMF